MRFLMVSIFLSVTFLMGHSAEIVSTLDFSSQQYQEFFEYTELKGIYSDELKQNFKGLSLNIIDNIIKDEKVDSHIREIIGNTVNILNIPTYVELQTALFEQKFKNLNGLIIDVITTNYKAAFQQKGLNNDPNAPDLELEARSAIREYNEFISGLDRELHRKVWLRLVTPAQIGLQIRKK